MANLKFANDARVEKSLQFQVRVNGGEIMSRRQLIEQCLARGYRVTLGRNGIDILQSPDGSYYDAKAITKIGMDYAKRRQVELSA